MRGEAFDLKQAKIIVGAVLVALYIAGLVLMFMRKTNTGLLLWVVSTLGGMGFLWFVKNREHRKEDENSGQTDKK